MPTFAGFELTQLPAGVPVLLRRDDRFKSFRLSLLCRRPLDRSAAARGLLPALLTQGTLRDPGRLQLARRMENLYGGSAVPGTAKIGETHALRLSLDCVAGRFLPGRPDQFGDGLALLADYLARPLLDGDGFPADTFERERASQLNHVRAEFDDKMLWARRRAIESACQGEPMAIPEHGGSEAIAALGRGDPEAARRDFLRHGDLVLLAAGALPDGVLDLAQAFLAELPERAPQPVPPPAEVAPRAVRRTTERAHLQQSKLLLVLRVPKAPAGEDRSERDAALRLFTSMLGGGPHARLFKEVREKRSLAYYAQALYDSHKGLLLVSVGLDEAAAPAVEEETMRQLDELRQGRFSADELDTARAGIVSALAAVDDSIQARLAFTAERWLEHSDRDPQQLAQLYAGIDAERTARSAAGVWLDHVYLLAPETQP